MPRQNLGPRLHQRADGIYEVRWTADRRSRTRSTGTANIDHANRFLAGLILAKDEGEVEVGHLTIEAALGFYEMEHVRHKVAGVATFMWNARNLKAHFSGALMGITVADVHSYWRKRHAGQIGRRSKDATIRRELSILIAAINHNVRHKRITPTQAPYIPVPDVPPPRDRWLTHEEADKLIAKCSGRTLLFVRLALATGSRKAALEELTWDQVKLDQRIIHLNPAGRKMTKKVRPTVPISDTLLPVLVEASASARNKFVLGSTGNVRHGFAGAVQRAGLKDVSPHVLRHTYATWAAQRGVDMWMIAGILGDTLATTTKNYAHHHPEYLRAAVI